jgi:outer membrane protein assembly factor BamB
VTKPDGTTNVLGPFTSDDVGSMSTTYIPTTTGKYYFQFSFSGQVVAGLTFKPSTSKKVELTVQQEPIEVLPITPLPSGYWERPINAENREWYTIAGNWLMAAYDQNSRQSDSGSAFNPYTTAPNGPHIVWTNELTFGGVVGGEFGYNTNYYAGLSYEIKTNLQAIINGRLYYNIFPAAGFISPAIPGVVCVDLRTGKEIWRNENMSQIYFGQILRYDSPDQHGATAYLWSIVGTNWQMYDAFTGRLLVTLRNATSRVIGGITANVVFGPNGELLVYALDGTTNTLAMWNSTLAIPPPIPVGAFAWMWRPGYIAEVDWRNGIQWNVTIPDVPGVQGLTRISSGVILAEAVLSGTPTPTFVHVAYSATTGNQLWVQNRTDMGWGYGGAGTPGLMQAPACPAPGEGVYVVFRRETMQWYAFDLLTGANLWTTDPINTSDWATYEDSAQIAYGKLYVTGYDGYVHAYDLKNGTELWSYFGGNAGLETPYGVWPFYGGITAADGKLYVANGEHSADAPLHKGEKLHCINATTGESIWNISGWFVGNSMAVTDGYMDVYNGYDNRMYCFGKGETATTVSASPKTSVHGDSVLIEGTVTDQSPGAKGTAAIADASMTAWMEYLYMQKPMPTNATGVPVTLSVLDSNGNYRDIGTTTSDSNGVFSFAWTPDIPGKYSLFASFGGSAGYYPSNAETAFNVEQAAATPAPTKAPVQSTADMYLLPGIIAIIIAIAIGFAITILVLRKRP